MRMNNFKVYNNDSKDAVQMAVYHQDDQGRDWYKSVELFTKPVIIGFDSDDRIVIITNDASKINPGGLSIADLDWIPKEADTSGAWFFKDGIVVADPEFVKARNEKIKRSLMRDVSDDIAALEDAAMLGNETEAESAKLKSLKEYRVKLLRLDVSSADVVWPTN